MPDPENNIDGFRKCSRENLLSNIKEKNDEKDNRRRFCFILGSGASRESGIRTGQEMQKDWLQKIKEKAGYKNQDIKEYIEEQIKETNVSLNIDELLLEPYPAPSKDYSPLFSLCFHPFEADGYQYLEKELEKAKISFGYYPLARILTETHIMSLYP